MIDPNSFLSTETANGKTVNSINQGYFAYELLYMSMLEEDPQEDLNNSARKLKLQNVNSSDVRSVVYNHTAFSKYKKIYMESADQNRRIMQNTFSAYKCKKCKSQKVLSNVVQTRGLDEPSDLYINCLACGAKYKEAE